MAQPNTPAFHHVVLKEDGVDKRLSKAQYDAMPLRARVKLILSGAVTFYDANNQILPSGQALIRQEKS